MTTTQNTFIHFPLLEGMRFALNSIFNEGRYADKVIEYIFRNNKKWGARDRALVAETIYGTVRYWKTLHTVIGEVKDPQDYIAAYFLLYKNEEATWKNRPEYPCATWKENYRNLASDSALKESFPDWLNESGKNSWGEAWPRMMHALNQPAPVVLRANTLKIPVDDLLQKLKSENIEVEKSKIAPDALILDERSNVFRTHAFKEGWFEVQDEGSQVIAGFCHVQPGQRVIDACAGAGGKTLHLAALMQNKGRIIAMDTEPKKLEELKRRARRNGAQNMEVRVIDSTKVIKRLEESADVLLLDAPCTGTGVIRRNPDAKWKLDPEFFARVQAEQEKILDTYPRMLKKDGLLVYATCSILKEENEMQVKKFLEKHPEFTVEEEKHLTPLHDGTDGFYMVRFRKNQ